MTGSATVLCDQEPEPDFPSPHPDCPPGIGAGSRFSYTPDGSAAYVVSGGVYRLDLQTLTMTEVVTTAQLGGTPATVFIDDLVPSADGQALYVKLSGTAVAPGWYQLATDGTQMTPVARTIELAAFGWSANLAPLPSGRGFVITEPGSFAADLRLYESASATTGTQLASTWASSPSSLAWSPDNRRLAFIGAVPWANATNVAVGAISVNRRGAATRLESGELGAAPGPAYPTQVAYAQPSSPRFLASDPLHPPEYSTGTTPIVAEGTASAPVSGVERVSLSLAGDHDAASGGTYDLSVPTSDKPEGRYLARLVATSGLGGVAEVERAIVLDRTEPGSPEGVEAIASEAGDEITINWDAIRDPRLADGSPGSGVDEVRTRHRTETGEWSSWTASDGLSEINLPSDDVFASTTVELQVKALDRAGNESAIADLNIPVFGKPSGPTVCRGSWQAYGSRLVDSDFAEFKPRNREVFATARIGCKDRYAHRIAATKLTVCVFVGDTPRAAEHAVKQNRHLGCSGRKGVSSDDYEVSKYLACDATRDGDKWYAFEMRLSLVGTPRYPSYDHEDWNGRNDGNPLVRYLHCPSEVDRVTNEVEGWLWLSRTRHVKEPGLTHRASRDPAEALRGRMPARPSSDANWWAAHHIVPAREPRFAYVQAQAFRCRLHPNQRTNGVYLRGWKLKDGSPDYEALPGDHPFRRVTDHVRLHSEERLETRYAFRLYNRLRAVLGPDDVCSSSERKLYRQEVSAIGDELWDGVFL